jgi:rhodanese-related sulfurtransferase
MGWHLAGYALERDQSRVAPKVSARGLERSNAVTERVAARFSVPYVSLEELEGFRHEADARTLFVMDVRSPAEFKKGHVPGSRCAPGGQLVQATDEYVGVRNARLVLVDDTGVRATSTASWLIQMGWSEVYVLNVGVDQLPCVHGGESNVVLSLSNTTVHQISVGGLATRVNIGNVVLFDLADSLTYRQGHLPGARMIRREEIPAWVSAQPPDREVVLLSPDGVLAGVASGDVTEANAQTLSVLAGGTKAWQAAGNPIEVGVDPCWEEDPADVWYKPYERRDAVEEAMQAYLDWELGLVAQVEKDGCVTFRRFD